MAEMHATTTAELKAALQTTGADVILDNDLDFNSVTISGTWCTIKANSLDGQGHTLFNIQTAASSCVFVGDAGVNISIHNVNFMNFLGLGSGGLIDGYNFNNRDRVKVYQCKFQGKAKTLFGSSMPMSGSRICSRCSFKVNSNCKIVNGAYSLCYFDLDASSSNFVIDSYLTAVNCYFKGHAKLPSGTLTSSSFNYNVWNVYNDNATTPTMQGSTNLYNSDRATFAGSGGTGLTDDQLKDRDYIANNTSFPIL